MATTKAINIQQRRCVSLLAANLLDGEQWFVEYAVLTGCDPSQASYAPYYECGQRVVLDTTHNPLTLWRPGWYRLVSDGELNPFASVEASDPFDCAVNAKIDNVAPEV